MLSKSCSPFNAALSDNKILEVLLLNTTYFGKYESSIERTTPACCETAPNALIARHFQIREVHARERVRALPLILSIAVLLVAIAGCCHCR